MKKYAVIFLFISMVCGCGSGQLNGPASELAEKYVSPLLKSQSGCQSIHDCNQNDQFYILSTSSEIHYKFYGILDKSLQIKIAEVLITNSGTLPIKTIVFFSGKAHSNEHKALLRIELP